MTQCCCGMTNRCHMCTSFSCLYSLILYLIRSHDAESNLNSIFIDTFFVTRWWHIFVYIVFVWSIYCFPFIWHTICNSPYCYCSHHDVDYMLKCNSNHSILFMRLKIYKRHQMLFVNAVVVIDVKYTFCVVYM